jgi:hypothetical protein
MDPWSVAAIVGLIFAGNKINSVEDPLVTQPTAAASVIKGRRDIEDALETKNMNPQLGRRIGDFRLQPKQEIIGSLQDKSNIVNFPFGQPVYNLYNRENISNKMNNLNPGGEPVHVGRGLGVCADVPAVGGFQQFFRVLPNNPNEERLIGLPGTNGGPSNPVVKNGGTIIGNLTHFPEKNTTYRTGGPSGEGQGGSLRGPEARPTFTYTQRPTRRAETGNTTLEGPAQYNVYQPYVDTGIKSLPRLTDFRSKPDRAANGQRMNVIGDPLSAGGEVTNLRRDVATDHPGPPAPLFGTVSQYVQPEFNDLNELKSQRNPFTSKLNIAKDNLQGNPYQISLSG